MGLYRNFDTQAEIDAEYNVEAAVPDMSPYVELYVGESAKARESLQCTLDIPFGPTIEETLDVFPAAQPGAPVLMFVHGGYWRILSSKEFSMAAPGPVARGYTVVVTNYTLCPKVTIPEITRQSRAALAWIYREIANYNGDPNRIFVSGHSAGGHQTAMLASTDWAADYGLPADLIKGAIPISGVFDLRPIRYSWLQPLVQVTEETVQRESPQLRIPDNGPPMLVTVGGGETAEFIRQSKDYLAAWQAQGMQGRYFEESDVNHFDAIKGFLDEGSELCEELDRFVAECES